MSPRTDEPMSNPVSASAADTALIGGILGRISGELGMMLGRGNMIGSATGTALAELGLARWSVRSEGCQGVRAGVRPALSYVEGSELVVGRITTRLDPFPACQLVLILPALG